MEEMSQNPDEETLEYVFNQTMLRIKDPEKSIDFYTRILGMNCNIYGIEREHNSKDFNKLQMSGRLKLSLIHI